VKNRACSFFIKEKQKPCLFHYSLSVFVYFFRANFFSSYAVICSVCFRIKEVVFKNFIIFICFFKFSKCLVISFTEFIMVLVECCSTIAWNTVNIRLFEILYPLKIF